MSDLISRQAAIDEANAWLLECLGVHKQNRSCGLIRRLEDLPPAQPETHDKRTGTHACDLISRAAVIDEIVNTVSEIGLHDNSEVARYGATFRQHEIIDIIEGMPSAQPDKEKISDALYNVYRNKGTSTSAEGVAAIKYYIAEIWREIYGEEGPGWMKK